MNISSLFSFAFIDCMFELSTVNSALCVCATFLNCSTS